jgi:hypothetical protein
MDDAHINGAIQLRQPVGRTAAMAVLCDEQIRDVIGIEPLADGQYHRAAVKGQGKRAHRPHAMASSGAGLDEQVRRQIKARISIKPKARVLAWIPEHP